MITDSKTFCALPWIHLSTRPNGHMRLCCTANASSADANNDKKYGGEVGILKNDNGKPANLNTTELEQAWNNQYMKSVRVQMLNNEIPVACRKCFKEEAAGHRSKRNWETEYWAKRLDLKKLVDNTSSDGVVAPQIAYIDLRLGTKCNLKCIMCSPHDSSYWVSDWKKLYSQIQNPELKEIMQWENNGQVDDATYDWHMNNKTFYQSLYNQLPNIHQLYFAGGESTIIDAHYEILEEAIKRGYAKNIELRYNSNGVELPDRLFTLWEQFKRVRFHFSLDCFEEKNSYIRYPSKWDQVVKNLHRIDNTSDKVEVTLACAVQILNIMYLPEFINWKLDQNFKKINPPDLGAGLINFHFVYHPANLNVKVLPLEAKLEIERKYDLFYPELLKRFSGKEDQVNAAYGIPRLKGIIKFMKSEDWSNRMPQFREYIQIMDRVRGTGFENTFPELAKICAEKNIV
jgi:hypothetical protein